MYKNTSVTNRKKVIIISIGFAVFIAIIVAITISLQNASEEQTGRQVIEQYDEASGETVLEVDQSPTANPDTATDQPIFLGFSLLIDRGLSQDQIESIKNAVYVQGKQLNIKATQVSVMKDSIKRTIIPSESGNTSILNFNIQINQESIYRMEVEDLSPTTTRIAMFDATDQELFNITYQ